MPFKTLEAAKVYERMRHQRDREKRNALSRARYVKHKDRLWKNADGTWKKPHKVNPEAHERHLVTRRQHYHANKERIRAQEKARRKAKEQVGVCPICGAEGVKLVWDHNHATGAFRAYICSGCNLALGHARESITTLRHMIDYLDTYGGKAA